jgi:hypothetical protein
MQYVMQGVLYLLFVVSVSLVPLQAQPLAQLSVQPTQQPSRDTTPLPKSLSTITTDTGDYAPGHHDFSKYTDIRMCLTAVANTRDVLRRTLKVWDNLELVQPTPERDTLPVGVAQVARNCGARFTVAGTAVGDLPLLFDLALFAGNDAMAHAVLARLVDTAPTAAEKHQVLISYIDRYLKAEPARVAAVDSIVAQMDKLGQTGLPERISAHAALMHFYGVTHYNSRLVRREAEQVIALIQNITAPGMKDVEGLESSYGSLMLWAWLNYPDSMPMVAQRYQQDLSRPVMQSVIKKHCIGNLNKSATSICNLAAAPLDSVIQSALPPGIHQAQQAAPPLRADFWFPAPGRDTLQPAPGVVSVILTPYLNDCINTPRSCTAYIDRVRRLIERYGSGGMSITMIMNAPGYRLGGDPGPADSVAQSYRVYLQDYFKWPVNVAVRTMKVIYSLPSPDGRVFYGSSKYKDVYDSSSVVIVDRAGKMIYNNQLQSIGTNLDLNLDFAPRFELFVEHAMAASKQPAGKAVHSVPATAPSPPR